MKIQEIVEATLNVLMFIQGQLVSLTPSWVPVFRKQFAIIDIRMEYAMTGNSLELAVTAIAVGIDTHSNLPGKVILNPPNDLF